MNKVITINLAGRSYSVEEPGYNALKAYLDKAAESLASNPDKDEILKDFNLAIAEKCDVYLSPSKNVVLGSEIEKILQEMGTVDVPSGAAGADGAHAAGDKKSESALGAGTDSAHRHHKKFYLLPETGVIFGVCSGVAAYFDWDVTLVRVAFVGLAILTHGAWILVYFLAGMFAPKANTPEEKAEAWGGMRATAQDLMQKARNGYDKFKADAKNGHQGTSFQDRKAWKKKMKQQMKEERRRWQQRNQWQYAYQYQQQNRSAMAEVVGSVVGMAWLAFFGYAAWLGYVHLPPLHDFFNAIGGAAGNGVTIATNWIKAHTGQ